MVDKLEQFIEIIGIISAVSNQDSDARVITNLLKVLQRFSTTQPKTPGPGHPAFNIPNHVLEHHVLCGLTAGETMDFTGSTLVGGDVLTHLMITARHGSHEINKCTVT